MSLWMRISYLVAKEQVRLSILQEVLGFYNC